MVPGVYCVREVKLAYGWLALGMAVLRCCCNVCTPRTLSCIIWPKGSACIAITANLPLFLIK